MHITWAFALATLLATVSAKEDHHPTGAPRPEPKPQVPYPWTTPGGPRNPNWPYIPADAGCDYKIKTLLNDPKTALMRAELKSTTHNAVQQVVRNIMAQYMQDHQKVAQCLYNNNFAPGNDNSTNIIEHVHEDHFQQATEDLIRALQAIQDPVTQKMMRHNVKEAVWKVKNKPNREAILTPTPTTTQ